MNEIYTHERKEGISLIDLLVRENEGKVFRITNETGMDYFRYAVSELGGNISLFSCNRRGDCDKQIEINSASIIWEFEEVKTEKQIEIEELEYEMVLMQERINKLKGGN